MLLAALAGCGDAELHYFGGVTYQEIAEALGISPATVDRDLRFATSWLRRELEDDG